jgi:hypothetical protein
MAEAMGGARLLRFSVLSEIPMSSAIGIQF